MLELEEYPDKIYEAQKRLDDLWQQYFQKEEKRDMLETEYEREAQEHDELTNRKKRKNFVDRKKQEDEYQHAHQEVVEAKRACNLQDYKIERLKREFEVAQLKFRQLHDME